MKIAQISTDENVWILRNPSPHYQWIQQVTDSSTNTKSKHILPDFSDMERNNIYAGTPPKVKPTTLIPILQQQQRRPPIPVRTDSTRSVGSSISNSFRHDSSTIMSRSADASSSCGLMTQMKNKINNMKSKSSCDIETSILNKISNGNFVPLQSVKEDEFLEVDHKKYSKNDHEQQRILIDILKQKYSSSNVSTPIMTRINSLHQRSSSTDDELSTDNLDGFNRNQRIRSSLPFIIKPAVKTNSLGLCFLICGNETKKVLLPPYISCLDTLKALFVRAFPQYLTMKQMDTDTIRIYIRETEKDIFYQLEDINDVKDRSVLKIVQLNNNQKPHVSFKEPETDELKHATINNDTAYQRLSRTTLTNKSPENFSRSLSEPRRETTPTQPSIILKSILASPRSGSTTPRIDEDDARTKMVIMEKQLESLTELVKELTKVKSNKSLHQQFYELKIKTNTLRNDLLSIRHMQQSLQENFHIELEEANKKIQNEFLRLNHNEKNRQIDNEFDLYIKSRNKIDQDLEDLEISVEELQNDVKTKQCFVTINNVESFALILSTISRSLVDLKASFPHLHEKLSSYGRPSTIKFLHEEPERLDYTIKKCKRLTIMLYQLKRLSITEENKTGKKITFFINEKLVDRKRLLEEIQSISLNSDGRMKAIEKAEKLRKCRLYYENQLENLKQVKSNSDQIDRSFDSRSLTNSLSTRTSVCSIDSNNCPSPSLSYNIRQTPITNDCKSRLKPPSKVTFSQQLIINEKNSSLNKKSKPNPPSRIQNTPSSSSAVSSASSSSSSCTGGRGPSSFCGIIPLLSVDRRHNGRCYSFSSSSTDTDSVISNSHKSPTIINPKYHQTTLMRASVTDL